ncbi:TetR/AcrR family transcriptional regulator [Sphingomonas hengshuiensis]|uniref:TetR/AcrR family transcriptional regulator n=1 Tax=Sphingomonas hengshuiensis TaxID=1609977 RepID=UPI0006991C82|nr:TetR/AcrR family transcriptional regulator [Sphingomonas hengshuiensis]
MYKRKFLLADPAEPATPTPPAKPDTAPRPARPLSQSVSDNPQTRARIEAAAVAVMGDGAKLTHDAVAERAGISRRTVYRYFPDQTALRQGAWKQLAPAGGIPQTLDQLLGEMRARFAQFDANAPAMTVAMASAEGRAIRNAVTPDRVAAYRAMLDAPSRALPEPDRTLAVAAVQLLSSEVAWREMRDQWGLTGDAIGIACRWAVEVLLADLRKRGDAPLTAGPA